LQLQKQNEKFHYGHLREIVVRDDQAAFSLTAIVNHFRHSFKPAKTLYIHIFEGNKKLALKKKMRPKWVLTLFFLDFNAVMQYAEVRARKVFVSLKGANEKAVILYELLIKRMRATSRRPFPNASNAIHRYVHFSIKNN
jgi:hypothetical protein